MALAIVLWMSDSIHGISSGWIARVLIPESLSPNPCIFAIVTCFICMAMHMLLGSTLAVMGTAPSIISFGITVGISPLVSAMLVYTAVCMHWLLPFHHMNLLVGVGEQGGGYTEKETIVFGIIQCSFFQKRGCCMTKRAARGARLYLCDSKKSPAMQGEG